MIWVLLLGCAVHRGASVGPQLNERVTWPVTVEFADEYRLAIGRAWFGTQPEGPQIGDVWADLDDSALGISLLDQVRRVCPTSANTCTVSVDGRPVLTRRFGGVVTLEFKVLRFVGLAPDAPKDDGQ